MKAEPFEVLERKRRRNVQNLKTRLKQDFNASWEDEVIKWSSGHGFKYQMFEPSSP